MVINKFGGTHALTRSCAMDIHCLNRNAYNMVINKFGDRLYNGLVETETAHLRGIAAKVEASQGEGFLRELKLRWEHHNKSMQMVRDILMVRRRPAGPISSPEWTCAGPALHAAAPPLLCLSGMWLCTPSLPAYSRGGSEQA
jgi:hypothetical protein